MRTNKPDIELFAKALADLRNKKNKTIFNVRDHMKWKNVTPYLRYEKGIHLPKYETLEEILSFLNATFAERALLLGLAGYLPSRPMPNIDQIQKELASLITEIRNHPYPTFVLDPGFVFWVANPAAMFFLGEIEVSELAKRRINAFDLAFDTRIGVSSRIGNIPLFRRELIRRFKGISIYQQHKAFYRAYPACMATRLQPEDYTIFKELWDKTGVDNREKSVSIEHGSRDLIVSKEVRMDFYVTERVFFLGDFFEIVRYTPTPSLENAKLVELQFSHFTASDDDCFKLWKAINVEEIIRDYS